MDPEAAHKRSVAVAARQKRRARATARGKHCLLRQIYYDYFAAATPNVRGLKRNQVTECLADGKQLNDEAINLYLTMLQLKAREDGKQIHVFSTFFFTKLSPASGRYSFANVERWGRRLSVNILLHDMVLVPIHIHDMEHWCLGCINIKQRKIELYDSLWNHDTPCTWILEVLRRYVQDEAKRTGNEKVLGDIQSWGLIQVDTLPQQTNAIDCGVFVLEFARRLINSASMCFSQKDIPAIRRDIRFATTVILHNLC